MAKEPINLGGSISGFPVYQPQISSEEQNTNGKSVGSLTADEMIANIRTSTVGLSNVPATSIQLGTRFKSSYPYRDAEEMAAQQQSAWDRWGNGATKMTGVATSTFLSGTIGTIHGIGSMITDGRFASFYDNPTNRSLDEFNKEMENYLPNYYSHAEQDANWYSSKNLLTTNFWSDKVLKNLGYSVGTIGGGFAWGAVLKGIGLTNALVKAGKGLEAVEAVENAIATAPKSARFGAISDALNGLSNQYLKSAASSVLTNADRSIISVMGTMGEAGMESLQNMNQFRDSFIQEYTNKNGYKPTGDDLDEINQFAEKVGNFTWGMNVALLSATNYIQLPKILNSSKVAEKRAMNEIVKDSATGVYKAAPRFLEKLGGKFGKSVDMSVKPLGLLFSPIEAFEEGAQFSIQSGVDDYFSRAYSNHEEIASFFETFNETLGNVLDEGVHKTLSTKEGIENILIGGISGGLQTSFSPFGQNSIKERGVFGTGGFKAKNTQLAVNALNQAKPLNDTLKDAVKYTAIAINSQAMRQEAIENNNTLLEKDYEKDYTLSYIIPRVKYGKTEAIKEEIGGYKKQALIEEGFQQLKTSGIVLQNETRSKFLERLDTIEKTANDVAKTYDLLNDKYSAIFNDKKERIYSDEVIDKMVYAVAKIADYDVRIPQVSQSLLLTGVETMSLIEEIYKYKSPSKELVKQSIDKIDKLQSISEDDLKQSLYDVIDLAKRRKGFIEEYNSIKNTPEKYSDKSKIEQTELTHNLEFINADEKKEKIEVGKEYVAPDTKKYRIKRADDNKWEIINPDGTSTFEESKEEADINASLLNEELVRLSKVKVINFNENGLVQVQSNGEIIDIPISKLKGYERVITEEEKKAEELAKNNNLRKELLGTAYTGVATESSEKEYEPASKKTDEQVVTSTKPTSSTLPHHIRTNKFGVNYYKIPNRENIQGVLVTQKTEGKLGLVGLSEFLKGESDVDASTTITMVMVDKKTKKPVDVDGKPLTSPSFDNAIFQAMPTPELKWSKEFGGESMFRKDSSKEDVDKLTNKYKEFVKNTLASNKPIPHDISASFGVFEYVEYLDEKAIVSVEEAGLIENSDLRTEKLIKVPTVSEDAPKGNSTFKTIVGRPLLSIPGAFVSLLNRKFTKTEAETLYNAVYQLSVDVFANKSLGSEKAIRLIKWLKSTIYWGTPKDSQGNKKPSGYNSIFLSDDLSTLLISGLGGKFQFTPASIQQNKAQIAALLEGMYNNVNNTIITKDELWNSPYEEITNISDNGVISSRTWPNYQSYLLSDKYDGKKRKAEEIPLFTQIRPLKNKEDVNRKGIYFTITDTVDEAPIQKVEAPIIETKESFVFDGKTENTFTTENGEFKFKLTPKGEILVTSIPGEVFAKLEAKVGKEKATELLSGYLKGVIQPDIDKHLTPRKEAKIKVESEGKSIRIPKNEELAKRMRELKDSPINNDDLRIRIKEQVDKFIPENWAKTEQWLKENFPNVPVYRVKNILQTTNGLQAWGMLKDGAIYVYENAEVGTIYHEVFESVWKSFTSPEEQVSINSEFRARKGSFIDRPTGKTVQYKNATDQEIKEQLSEEFRDFVLYKKIPVKPSNGTPFIVRLFNDIVNFIKSFFTGEKATSNTEKLFNKIGKGYYKQYTPTSNLAFAKEGIIDIEEVIVNNESQFRIKDIPADVLNDIIQQMTWKTFKLLTREGEDLFNVKKQNREQLYKDLKSDLLDVIASTAQEAVKMMEEQVIDEQSASRIVDNSTSLWETIDKQWNAIQDKYEEHLIQYSIEFDENDELQRRDEDKIKESNYVSAEKVDGFRKANGAIKLLLSTIPIINNNTGKPVQSSIYGIKLLPTTQAYISIKNRVADSRNVEEMMQKLKEMSEEDPTYKSVYQRLTSNSPSLFEIQKAHQAQLLTSFWKTFKQQNSDVKVVYILENGDVEIGDSNLSTAARQTNNEYVNNIIRKLKRNSPYYEYSEKEKKYIHKKEGKTSIISKVDVSTPKKKLEFLSELGVQFSTDEYYKLPHKQQEIISDAASGIKKSLSETPSVKSISVKTLDINRRLLQLATIRATINNPEFSSTFFNVAGERVQTYIGTNIISNFYDYISKIENKEELQSTPYAYLLTDTFSKNSVLLDKMFDKETGKRISGTENLMKAGWADGTLNIEKGKKKQSSKLTYKERLTQEINLNLKGYYYDLVAGDASMEHMTYMSNTVPSLIDGWTTVQNIFKGYFIDELNLSRENRKIANVKDRATTDLRFFKDILGEELHNKIVKDKDASYQKYSSQIQKAVEKYIKQEAEDTKKLLQEYGILIKDEDKYFSPLLSFKSNEDVVEDVINRQLQELSVNYMITNIEFHKLLFSDPYQYSDELKRIKVGLSPSQSIINNSPEMNSLLNKMWNRGFDVEDIGNTDFTRDYFTTITLKDVQSTSDLKDYGTFDETDGGGMISMKADRWLRIKAGNWNDNEEKQYRYDVAFEKDIKGLPLSKEESKLLKGSNPQVRSTYKPLKPKVFGNKANGQEFNSIVVDKFSLYPLSFRILHEMNPESNAIKLYNKMQKESIDYTVFNSGRKVGSENVFSTYNEDGSFNTLPFQTPTNIPHQIISIQTDVPSKEDWRVTRGSQITKLSTLDMMEAGVPIDFESNKKFTERYKSWYKLSEDKKQKISPLYKEIKNNQEVLEKSIENGVDSLLKRMGITQNSDGSFTLTNISKAASLIRSEVLKREVNDNISDALRGFENGDVVLEATPLYFQIRQLLYSLADKDVISPKISGGERVQIPSTFLESNRAKHEKNGVYSSDILSFYNSKDGKVQYAEIMVGRWWFDDKFSKSLSDDELLEYLNKPENKHILEGVAFRIPTQKQNSIEVFKIAKFLPREFGDSVVVPSALVKKVGSDFDIDKLFIFLKNTYKDVKGNIKSVPFLGYGQEAKDKFSEMYDKGEFLTDKQRGVVNKWIKNRKKEEQGTLSEYFGEEFIETEAIEDLLDSQSSEEVKDRTIEKVYKQSLENAYIASLEQLISNPLNFDQLIKPNDASFLKELAAKITKKRGISGFDYTNVGNMLNRHFMSRLRQAFVSGKYAIGIAAVSQTNHSLNQRQPLYIDSTNLSKVDEKDLFWLNGATGSIDITFKNYNKIDINNQSYPSLSGIQNQSKDYISDIIGMFIDGYVDISKGPWIMELGATPNTAPTWLFLLKLGVPLNDVAYFMNQPIIKDYLNSIENDGYSWLFIEDNLNETLNKYPSSDREIVKVKEIPSATKLYESIGKDKFSSLEGAEQQFILKEFLKYSKMANQLFYVTQGTNFDTANFSDPYLISKKLRMLDKARNTIFTGVDGLLDNSYIGKLRTALFDIRDAFSTILTSDTPNVRELMEQVLNPYIDETDREFLPIAKKAVATLFDWAVQTNTELNQQIQNILLSDKNTAEEVMEFVESVKEDDKHPLYNNQVVNLITLHSSDKENTPNNLKIKNKDNKVYDQNQMIYAFEEIKQYLNGINSNLYNKLITLSVLQSGLTNSPISFTNLIPYDDFTREYNTILSQLETLPNLENFYNLNIFQRSNWNDGDVVPYKKARWGKEIKQDYMGNWVHRPTDFFRFKNVNIALKEGRIPQLLKLNSKAANADKDVIVYTYETGTPASRKKMRKEGDYSYIKKYLFQKVYKGNTPLFNSYKIKNKETGEDVTIIEYIYKAINAWGDSHQSGGMYFSANEFYNSPRKSLIDNGFVKVDEVEDSMISELFETKKTISEKKEAVVKIEIKEQPKIEGKTKDIKLPTRSKTKEKYKITLKSGSTVEREGYKIIIPEYPKTKFYITKELTFDENKVTSKDWHIDDVITGLTFPTQERTIEDILKEFQEVANEKAKLPEILKILKTTGLFDDESNSNEPKCS